MVDPPVAVWVPGRVSMCDSAGTVEDEEEEEACGGDAQESKEERGGFITLAGSGGGRAMRRRMKSVWKPSTRIMRDLHS